VPAAELCSGGFSHLSEINSKTINFYFKSYKKIFEKNIYLKTFTWLNPDEYNFDLFSLFNFLLCLFVV
jgi:hypothetical protein